MIRPGVKDSQTCTPYRAGETGHRPIAQVYFSSLPKVISPDTANGISIPPIACTCTEMLMDLIKLLILIATLIVGTGCELHQVKGEVAGVEVQASTKGSSGDFCPPGQARKDRC